MRKNKLISLVLVVALISNVAFAGPVNPNEAIPDAHHPSDTQLAQEQAAFEKAAQEVGTMDGNALPGPTKDEFGLKPQYLTVNGRDYRMTDANLPKVIPADFEKDVSISSEPGSGSITFILSNEKQYAVRTIVGYEILAGARDKDFFIFLAKDGFIYGMDLGLAKEILFESPFPIFKLASFNMSLLEGAPKADFESRASLSMPFAPNAVRPLDLPLDYFNTAGDFVLYGQHQGSIQKLGLYDRDIMRTLIYKGEAALGFVAFLQNPGPNAKDMMTTTSKKPTVLSLQKDESVRAHTNAILDNMDPLTAAVAAKLPPQILTTWAHLNRARTEGLRDRYSDAERDDFQARAAKVNAPPALTADTWQDFAKEEDLGAKAKSSLHRLLTPARMKIMALMIGGAGDAWLMDQAYTGGRVTRALGAGAALASQAMVAQARMLDVLYDRATPEIVKNHAYYVATWATHFLMNLYDSVVPQVTRDTAYFITDLKSMISLESMIGVMWAIGAISATWIFKKPGAIAALARQSFRIVGYMSLPFYHYITKMVSRPQFIEALQHNSSATIFPNINEPQTANERLNNVPEPSDKKDRDAALQARRRSLAWALASIIVCDKSEVDPGMLKYLAQQGRVTPEIIDKLHGDPQAQAQLAEAAQEAEYAIMHLASSGGIQDLQALTPAEIKTALKLARETFEQAQTQLKSTRFENNLESAEGRKLILAESKVRWLNLTQNVSQYLGSWGIAESLFLRSAEPSRFVRSYFWQQFVIDYSLGVSQIGLYGPRANLADPSNLAASPHNFMYTIPAHRYDQVDQVRGYGINSPASLALVYQKNAIPEETRYQPIEELNLGGELRPDGFFRALWGAFGGVFKVDYRGIFLRSLAKRTKTLQFGLISAMIARVLVGGQHFDNAFYAFLYVQMAAEWGCNWPWTVCSGANLANDERVQAFTSEFRSSRVRLQQGLRIGDTPQAAKAYADLAKLYGDSPVDLPPQVVDLLPEIQNFLENPNSADIDRTRQQMSNFEEQLRSGGQTLLDIASKASPRAQKVNRSVEWTTVMAAALATTYIGTKMNIYTFSNLPWGPRLLGTALFTFAFYTTVYYGQGALVYGYKKIEPHWIMVQNQVTATLSGYTAAVKGYAKDRWSTFTNNLSKVRTLSPREQCNAILRIAGMNRDDEK